MTFVAHGGKSGIADRRLVQSLADPPAGEYDSVLASETTIGGRRLSPEFWAIVGSAITLLVGLIALAALMLTVSGWLREDIRALDTKLDAKVNMLQSDLTGIRSVWGLSRQSCGVRIAVRGADTG